MPDSPAPDAAHLPNTSPASDRKSGDSGRGSAQVQPIDQTVRGDRTQTIGQVVGGMVVYVSGGQAVIQTGTEPSGTEPSGTAAGQPSGPLGPNPYKGLLAFQETDGDRFFGRDSQIQQLYQQFRALHESDEAPRFLPIYGPSGSGKSSLARAGLIPALGQRPLPGRERARVTRDPPPRSTRDSPSANCDP